VTEKENWDKHWIDFAAANQRNPAQEYRQRLVLSLLEEAAPPSRLLDIGSGSGELLVTAGTRWPNAELLGLELSEAAVAQARAKLPGASFCTVDLLGDAQPQRGAERWASHAVCSEVLEHVEDPIGLLQCARRWLAPACHVVITVPGGPMSAFDRYIGHRRHFTPHELSAVMTAAGLETLLVSAAGFPFFNLYRELVILRGEKLIDDAKPRAESTAVSLGLRGAMALFRALFRLNLSSSRFGWQTIGLGLEPGGTQAATE
jgi:SAM-dependent methyltransferase